MKRIRAAFVFILAVFALPALAQHRAGEIGVEFPAELGGFRFVTMTQFPQPGAGYAIRYEQGPIRADIFIYTRNVAGIGDGTEHPTVAREFQVSVDEAMAGYRARNEQVIAREPGVLNLGVAPALIQFRSVEFLATINGQSFQSYLLVAGLRGHFIKLRVSHPQGANPRSFGDALGVLLARSAPGQPAAPATK